MRCSCCDKELTDSEATAKYVEADGSKPHRFVDMCSECLGYMPSNVRVVRRPQADKREEYDPYDPYHLGDGENEWDDY